MTPLQTFDRQVANGTLLLEAALDQAGLGPVNRRGIFLDGGGGSEVPAVALYSRRLVRILGLFNIWREQPLLMVVTPWRQQLPNVETVFPTQLDVLLYSHAVSRAVLKELDALRKETGVPIRGYHKY